MNNLTLQISPHMHDRASTTRIMLDVIIALMPTAVASVILFGWRSALVIAVCVAAAVLSEWLFELICKKENTVSDLSAVVTGILLAFNLPVDIKLWQAAFGSVVAIVVVKQLFGGIGKNFANPAITARIVMFISFSSTMSKWVLPLIKGDASTGATPLAVLNGTEGELPPLKDMLLGIRGGCIGETCALTLIIGGVYLLVRKVITWHAPVAFIGTVFLFTLILGENALYHVLAGGLLLGAIFMATDYSTTPYTKWGKVIFGIGCGIFTVVIRKWGSYPEGVSFSILFMNIVTPFINKLTHSNPFGGVRNEK
ncbi:MAG: RnfABCDGE type electron transport complex subunit D [Clostridia bacterium]|nr:RnfABCDGE type electron transport complex subunit D [Clostridia bacterium]